jgi:GH35 family endo-1,4-beta-xylanase
VTLETAPTYEETLAIIQEFGDLGLEVHVAELDVECPACDGTDDAALES